MKCASNEMIEANAQDKFSIKKVDTVKMMIEAFPLNAVEFEFHIVQNPNEFRWYACYVSGRIQHLCVFIFRLFLVWGCHVIIRMV